MPILSNPVLTPLCPTAKKKINNNSIFGHNLSKVLCNQSACAPIARVPVIAGVYLLYESMTHVLGSLSHRTTFNDLHIG